MASVIYTRFFLDLAIKALSWSADAIQVALVDSTYTPDKDHTRWVTGSDPYDSQITGSGYTAGGATLANATAVIDTTNDLVKLDGDDVTWATSTITARNAVLFDSTIANKNLVACFQFTEDKSSANGDFTIQWNASGLMTLQQS
jgi:hypothetical protein